MKSKLVNKGLTVLVGIGLSLYTIAGTVHAATNENDIKTINDKQKQNSEQQEQKQNELNAITEQKVQIQKEIESMDTAIMETDDKISKQQNEMKDTQDTIEQLKKETTEIQKRIDARDSLLKERMRSIYKNGGSINYLEVLLGAQSFSDLIDRVVMLNLIVQNDKNIIEEQLNDKQAMEEKTEIVEKELQSLENMLVELKGLKQGLEKKIDEKQKLIQGLKGKENELYNEFTRLEEIAENLKAQEVAIKKEMERKRRESQETRQTTKRKDTSSLSSSSFIWPTDGRLTSNMGSRWNRFHAGIDIAKNGSVPVSAAASGTVIRSYYSTSYGNVVFISHYIDGQLYTTVYAHMSSRTVSSGQTVSQRQLLGYQGNTGMSFGQHLHFELHKGPWNINKSNAVNPLNYLK